MAYRYTRRRVLTGLSFAGVAPLVAVPRALAADPPPETMSVRIPRFVGAPLTCLAPLYAAEEFLRAEGFTVLIVEQNVQQVLRVVDRAYLLEAGTIRAAGTSAEMMDNDTIKQAYLGV